MKHYRTLWTVLFSRYSGSISICYVRQWLKYSEWIWRFETRKCKQVKSFTSEHFRDSNLIYHVTLCIKIKKKYSEWIWRFEAREGKKVKYVFANTTTQREKKLNPHANTPAAVQMIEINRKYENTRQIHRLLTNQKLGFLYKV